MVETGHFQRKESGLKVRQPLAKITVVTSTQKPESAVLEVMAKELNVKEIIWEVSETKEASVTIDTQLTPELEQEGLAREIIRSVQQARKEANIGINESIDLVLPQWPALYENEIREKTKALSLTQGESLSVQVRS